VELYLGDYRIIGHMSFVLVLLTAVIPEGILVCMTCVPTEFNPLIHVPLQL
jgi:hypothetical protein